MNKPAIQLEKLKTVALSGFVAGTLDIIAAISIYAVLLDRTTAVRILQSIASGIYGKAAFTGGMETTLYGLFFHYSIATSWAAAYFFLFPNISFLQRQRIISGLIYGIVVWLIMNLVVLPFSNVTQGQFTLQGVLTGIGILMVCVGLPISLITHKHFTQEVMS